MLPEMMPPDATAGKVKAVGLIHVFLIVATFLCSLVAGFLFAFAVVAMPGIRNLKDREFVKAFQQMDGVIRRNHPVFVFVWLGSVLAVLAAAVIGLFQSESSDRWLLAGTAIVYFVGVQLPTFVVNIPLNNRLQAVNAEALDESVIRAARKSFEDRWNRWNVFRTIVSCLVSLALMVLLLRL